MYIYIPNVPSFCEESNTFKVVIVHVEAFDIGS